MDSLGTDSVINYNDDHDCDESYTTLADNTLLGLDVIFWKHWL